MPFRTPLDLGQKLDSLAALRYVWLNWRVVGVHPTRTCRRWYNAYAAFVNVAFVMGLPLLVLANLRSVQSMAELVENLWVGISITTCMLKHFVIVYHRADLLHANALLRQLDERCGIDKDERRHILAAVAVCHRFNFYVPFYFFINATFDINAIASHRLPQTAWYPAIPRHPELSYVLAYAHQKLAQTFMCVANGASDMYPQCYLALLLAHMRALCARVARIGWSGGSDGAQPLPDLVACIEDHKCLLRYYEHIRPVIARTIFLQFFITATALALTAINLVAFNSNALQLLFTVTYTVAIIAESLPCCWYANALLEQNDCLARSVFACNWPAQSPQFRRVLLFFLQRAQKWPAIVAGSLVPVTLQTFLSILQFSFSVYTLMSAMNDDKRV